MNDLLIGIGDLHGHSPALAALLDGINSKYDIFENKETLKLRESVKLVFTGDYIDREETALKIIETQMRLKASNPQNVVQLFGNHELMALGCLGATIEFSERGNYSSYFWTLHGANGGAMFLREFGNDNNEIFKNYVKRMSRDGDLGKWIRRLEPLHFTNIGGKKVLFVHAGIPTDLRNVNRLEDYVESFSEHIHDTTVAQGSLTKYVKHPLTGSESVFWDRSFPKIQDKETAEEIVKNIGVSYIVIGHTPGTEINNYFGKIFNIDVGMTPAYGENEPAAIVFKENEVCGFYVNRGEVKLA